MASCCTVAPFTDVLYESDAPTGATEVDHKLGGIWNGTHVLKPFGEALPDDVQQRIG